MRRLLVCLGLTSALSSAPDAGAAASPPLLSGWTLQSSAVVKENGGTLSRPGHPTAGWHAVSVPSTVVGALVDSGHFKDPYPGMSLREMPGMSYPIGTRFTLIDTPKDSPFAQSWWYRTEFDIPAQARGRAHWLRFKGINYRANIWMNGRLVAGAEDVVGVFRRYEFDVTALSRPGERNALAVEVVGPEPHDLAIMWVDWNPTPPDKNMGLWDEVSLVDSGPLALRNAYVVPDLDLPSLDRARLTVTAEVWNATDRAVSGVLKGALEGARFQKAVTVPARERVTVRLTEEDTPELRLDKPRIWWPYRMGGQDMYTLTLDLEAEGAPSDKTEVRFGVQEMSSELTDKGHRMFRVNGKPVLIRGGGWASDMLLRPASRERLLAELRYTREMGLNTIRLEGKLESDLFYELADEQGILVMPGWCCCDQWELWKKWDAEDYRVAPSSLASQILRLRNHPSVIAWFNGSDFPPPPDVEQAYLDVLKRLDWNKPVLSNATGQPSTLTGPSGAKMLGPYDYVAPSYWLTDTKAGGAFGFATEIGPGGAVPPIESLKKMLPPGSLWPIDSVWKFHAGGDEFKDLDKFTGALDARYGKATGVEDYARKAQALAYENQRAMFEGYGRNKYTSTGVIQWMLNNAWPSMIWHLYDWYLRPGGGYFGTKKACEPVHVQYDYNDRGISVVNDTLRAYPGLTVSAEIFDLSLASKFAGQATVNVGPDAVVKALSVPLPKGISTTYFLRLRATDADGKEVSSNFYWLSTQEDVHNWSASKWFYTPVSVHSDLTALAKLPATTLAVSASPGEGAEPATRVKISNTGQGLAFQVRLKAVDPASGEEILPVFWDDNYIALFPGESREIRVAHPAGAKSTVITAQAWNAPEVRQ